jgi:hypothetical protein
MAAKTTIGLKEHVTILGRKRQKKVIARIDTGASKCSIDTALAKSLSLGPVLREKRIKSAHGTSMRALILARIMIAGRTFKVFFTIADRKHMKYPVLIGRNLLRQGFVIDPARKLG